MADLLSNVPLISRLSTVGLAIGAASAVGTYTYRDQVASFLALNTWAIPLVYFLAGAGLAMLLF